MGDTTITKVNSNYSPTGKLGQRYLASGKSISMRLWDESQSGKEQDAVRDYETVGFVLDGSAELSIEGQTLILNAGDSWVVPKGARHTYTVNGHFRAVEATHPPAQIHGRDE